MTPQLSLFDPPRHKKKKTAFDDYVGFVKKFEAKLTTDDCYTPPEVYDAILCWLRHQTDIKGREIVRPFYPGGDYERYNYPPGCVVVDNPPFSIVSKICRFYLERGIGFFLFCPHLTAFSSDIDCTHVITDETIIYQNGANVNTAFASNLFGDVKILGAPDLAQAIEAAQKSDVQALPKYEYPPNVLTVSKVAFCVSKGIHVRIMKAETAHVRGLKSQKAAGKSIFGSGFLLPDGAAASMEAAKEAAKEAESRTYWPLSESERKIIEGLGSSPTRHATLF